MRREHGASALAAFPNSWNRQNRFDARDAHFLAFSHITPRLLRFTAEGSGFLDDSADPNLKHGSVIWKIESGEGQFAGASGLITSNFTIRDGGEVVDNHFGLIFLK